jgi:hypothetical protein
MKKSEAIKRVKEGTHAIHMDRKEKKDIELLNELLCLSRFLDLGGQWAYYWKIEETDSAAGFMCEDYTHLPTIKITEITEEETFESGELVEVSNNEGVSWVQRYFIGVAKNGDSVCEDNHYGLRYWELIRKINPAIEQIREIMKKNNISKEDL